MWRWLWRWRTWLGGEKGAATAEYALVSSDNVRHVRRVDDLGRVALPAEMRVRLHVGAGDALEVVEVPGGILLRPLKAGKARSGPTCRA